MNNYIDEAFKDLPTNDGINRYENNSYMRDIPTTATLPPPNTMNGNTDLARANNAYVQGLSGGGQSVDMTDYSRSPKYIDTAQTAKPNSIADLMWKTMPEHGYTSQADFSADLYKNTIQYMQGQAIDPNSSRGKSMIADTMKHGSEELLPHMYQPFNKDAHIQVGEGKRVWDAINSKWASEENPDPAKAVKDETAQVELATKKKNLEAINNAESMSPDSIENAAIKALKTGDAGVKGQGTKSVAIRTAISNRQSEIMKEQGISPNELPYIQEHYKANAKELAALQKLQGPVLAFSDEAESNLKLANELANKLDNTRSPLINRYLNASERTIKSDKDLAKFDLALYSGLAGYVKLNSSTSGNGGMTSDSARAEARQMINDNQSKGTIKELLNQVLNQEIGFRKQGFVNQIQRIKDDMDSPLIRKPQGQAPTDSQAAPQSTGTGRPMGGTGTVGPAQSDSVKMVAPDGRTLTVPHAKVSDMLLKGAKLQ